MRPDATTDSADTYSFHLMPLFEASTFSGEEGSVGFANCNTKPNCGAAGEHVLIAARMAPFDVAPIAALRARRFQSLSPVVDQMSEGEALDGLGAFLVNDPDIDGRLQVVVVGGLSLVRNEGGC
jgi:hypothetical protein